MANDQCCHVVLKDKGAEIFQKLVLEGEEGINSGHSKNWRMNIRRQTPNSTSVVRLSDSNCPIAS
jgi:hypothetical protein